MATNYTNYDSNVNANGLNENFPVPGTNNSSQGFRDNFAKIKGTIGQVAVELTQLRNYVLRKLEEGEIFSHDNDLSYFKLIRAQMKAYSETFFDIGDADVVVAANFLNGNFQKVTLTKTADLSLSNFPIHNAVGRMTLWVTVNDVSHRLYLPPDCVYGTDVDYVNTGRINFPTVGNYLIELISVNASNQYWLVSVQGLETGGSGSSSPYQLPVASTSTLGGVKIDGVTIGINNGIIRVIGGVPILSDQKIKTDVVKLENALDKICLLNGYSYTRTDTGQRELGVIAQEVEQVVPELVQEQDDLKHVHYGNMNALVIEAIKDLRSEIDQIKRHIGL